MAEYKCPKCGGTDFLVSLECDINVSTENNFGNLNFNFIKEIACADMGCGEVLKNSELRNILVLKAKALLETLKEKTLLIK